MHRPRPAVLHHRRADQPDRPPDLPGAAARRRPVGDRARRRGAGRGRRRRARRQHGRAADRRADLLADGDHAGAGAHRPADLHRLLGRRGARGRAGGLPGPRAGQLVTAEDERMAAILPLVKRYGAAVIALPNDARRDPDGGRQAARARRRKIVDVATKEYGIADRGHRDRPARDADRRRHHRGRRQLLETMRRIREEFGAQHDLRRVQRLLRHARAAHHSAPRSCRWR